MSSGVACSIARLYRNDGDPRAVILSDRRAVNVWNGPNRHLGTVFQRLHFSISSVPVIHQGYLLLHVLTYITLGEQS